jgi:hypothetical protein
MKDHAVLVDLLNFELGSQVPLEAGEVPNVASDM